MGFTADTALFPVMKRDPVSKKVYIVYIIFDADPLNLIITEL